MPHRPTWATLTKGVVGASVAVIVLVVGYAAILYLTADHGRFRSTPSACALIGNDVGLVFNGSVFRVPKQVGDDSECHVSEQEDFTAGAGLILTVELVRDPFSDAPKTAAEIVDTVAPASRSVRIDGLGDQAQYVTGLNWLYIRISNVILTFRPNASLNLRDDTQLAGQLQELGNAAVGHLPRR